MKRATSYREGSSAWRVPLRLGRHFYGLSRFTNLQFNERLNIKTSVTFKPTSLTSTLVPKSVHCPIAPRTPTRIR